MSGADMIDITGFLVCDSDGSKEKRSHSLGDHLAFDCDYCGHPVLAVAREGCPGFDENTPAVCNGCETEWFLNLWLKSEKLYIHSVAEYRLVMAEMDAEMRRLKIIK